MTKSTDVLSSATARAALGAIIGGPLGVVTALATGWPLVVVTALLAAAGGVLGALMSEQDNPREAAVDAMLPVGAWLVGAAIGWVILASLREEMPRMMREYPSHAALGAAVIGGTLAVVVLMVRLGASELREK